MDGKGQRNVGQLLKLNKKPVKLDEPIHWGPGT